MMKTTFTSKLISAYKKYEEYISYLFFGVLTTIVNYASFAILRHFLGDEWIHWVNAITFVLATTFAYVTNKLFVFKSKSSSFGAICKEVLSFFVSRISSFFIEELGLYLCVNILNVGQYKVLFTDGTMIAKIVLSFLAVILNYFFSKLIIFRKKGDGNK